MNEEYGRLIGRYLSGKYIIYVMCVDVMYSKGRNDGFGLLLFQKYIIMSIPFFFNFKICHECF